MNTSFRHIDRTANTPLTTTERFFLSRPLMAFILFVSLLSPIESFAACVKAAATCIDATPCKTISGTTVCLSGQTVPAGGVSIPETCWDYSTNYTCPGSGIDTCAPLAAKGCTITGGGNCVAWSDPPANTKCSSTHYAYTCNAPAPAPDVVTTSSNCSVNTMCAGATCFNITDVQNNDMQKTAAMIEMARQAAMYQDKATLEFFKGKPDSCVNALFGLANCCTVGSAPGMSNAQSFASGQVINFGSAYVYDALTGASTTATTLIGQAYTAMTSTAATSASLSTATAGAGAAGGMSAGFMGVTASYSSATGLTFAFDPTSLAISLAVMVIMEMLACTQDEQMLSMKRGQNLCVGVGSYCSLEVPIIGICLAYTEGYCCFNSKLGRIINQQGRPLLGKTWGSPQSPNCSGFTPAEFQSLDFSKLDLTEFMNDIKANINPASIQSKMQTQINNMSNSNAAINQAVNPSAPASVNPTPYTGGFAPVGPQ